MTVMKVILLLVALHSCSCIENFDTEKCKDRFGASLNENFALFKPTWQTSTKDDAVASRAVDGNTNPHFGNLSCSQTDPANDLVWQVDLQEDIYVTSVTITTRADQYWSSSDFYQVYGLLVNGASSQEWKYAEGFFPNTGERISVTCYMPKKSNKVQIRLLKPGGILSLCEVEVHGRKFDYYENEVNYALRQTGKQSTVHAENGNHYSAILALNGDRNTYFHDGSCMHTKSGPYPAYWSVDLGKIITVNAVTITSVNLPGVPHRIADFDLRIGFADKNDDENYESCVGHILGFGSPETRTIFCTNPTRGRYVTIVSFVQDFFHLCEVSVHGDELECTAPDAFGFETFKIQDSQFNASSFYDSHNQNRFRPPNARLNFRGATNPLRHPAWIAHQGDTEPWIEIDLLWIVTVAGVLTQGRARVDQWVTSYSVSSKVDGMEFQFYMEEGQKKIFTANSDSDTVVRQNLRPAVVARWFRVHPVTWVSYCAMRLELIGCQNGLHGTRPPQALGMSNGQILDAQLSASSNDADWEPTHARLQSNVNGWAATTPADSWFQVNFLLMCVVLEIKTQGSATEQYWIKEYQISHGSDTQWFGPYMENGVKKTFVGNIDQHSIVSQTLVPVIVAGIIRIHPISWEVKTGLRAEFIGYYRENSIPRPLGMENRFIQDSQISFSTAYEKQGYQSPWLNAGGGCWVPHYRKVDQWLQVDFLRLTEVTKVKTQGRPWDKGQQWVVTYHLAFGNDGDHFLFYQRNGKTKEFSANWDITSVNSQTVSPAIVSRFLRIYPQEKNNEVAMRLEFEGYYLGFEESCQTARALGMEDRRISVHQISASSYLDERFLPDYGRLNVNATYGAWIALHLNTGQWYQVDFETIVKLIEIHSQGRTPNANEEQWVKEYTVSFANHPDRIDSQFYQKNGQTKVFQANFDTDTIVRNTLLPAIVARIVRLHIQSWNDKIAMRVEFFGTYEAPHGPALIDPDYVALDNRLTASSFIDHRHRAIHGVISDRVNATSWTPEVDQKGEYIQVDLLQLTPISGVGLRTGGDQPNDSYTEVMMQYSDIEGSWKIKKDYRGEIMCFYRRIEPKAGFPLGEFVRAKRLFPLSASLITSANSREQIRLVKTGQSDNCILRECHPVPETLSTSDCDVNFEKLVVARYVRLVITGWGRRTGFVFQLYGTTEYHKASAGIEDGSIKDNQMKSSNHPNDPHPAHEARLNHRGAWCGNTLRRHLYLQIDFLSNFEVHAVATQAKSVGIMATVTHYKLSSTVDHIHWSFYQEEGIVKIFQGNTSCRCSRKHLVQPFLVRSLRFLPTSWKNRPCMRVDVYGVYKGILQVHVRSGPLLNAYGTELTRDCSIKLNGEEMCKSNDGINVVVASCTTGDLISSNSTAEYSLLNNLLTNIENESIVVLATQNVHERRPEETLQLLQSLGGINLRYSLTSEHDNWILVGYKGKQKVDWIAEKVGKKGEAAVRVATTVHLNQIPTTPEFHKYYMSAENTSNTTELSIAGRHSLLVHNVTARCVLNDTDCQPGLSLAMWMKPDMPRVNRASSRFISTEERFVFKYYSSGYNYIIPPHELNWIDSRRYCLTLGTDLPVIWDAHTEKAINKMLARAGVSNGINIGLRRHPVTSEFEWVDGSPFIYMHWHSVKPDSGECSSRFSDTTWDSLSCDAFLRQVMCQQSIEDLIGLVPMGVEHNVIPDDQMTSSTIYSANYKACYGRINTDRNIGQSWCTLNNDIDPYLQVDLGHIKIICGVGTQGRGKYDIYKRWATSYLVRLSNDSSDWIYLRQDGSKKEFQANDDRNSMVINRFHQPAVAHIIRLEFESWNENNNGLACCVRMEVFTCSNTGKEDKEATQTQHVPRSVAETEPENCLDVLMSGKTTDGVYMINPGNGAFPVYCDQTTDGGGWTVLQRRMDGTVDFYRNYEEYEAGFGDISGEHWLGLAKMATLTHSYSSDLRVDLKDWYDATLQVVYSDFMIDEARWAYKLRYSACLGPGADSLTYGHKNAVFHAKDQGKFKYTAVKYHGGWWYSSGSRTVNLNGIYYDSGVGHKTGIKWIGFRTQVLKESKMMIRWNGKGGKQGALDLTDWHTYKSVSGVYKVAAVAAKLDGLSFLNMNNDGIVYLQGDFLTTRRLTHISTQGGTNSHFVKQYSLQLNSGKGDWIDYKENGVLKIFEGNNELTQGAASHVVSNCLKETELARMVRFYPIACEGSCSLRLEVYSCFESCSKAVGVQHENKFSGDRMKASSFRFDGNPWRGRLHSTNLQWTTDSQRPNEFLEIWFYELLKITSIATQGGIDCWVKSFSISYRDKNIKWNQYKGKNGGIFPGNRNTKTVVRTHFDAPFLAHMVRFVAKTWHNKICMRSEVYGCAADNPIFVVYTQTATAGKNVTIKGKYRYCAHCECPGCLKSLWMRVFGQDVLVSAYFLYDCQYHEFEVSLNASIVPGRHKIYMGASESGNLITDENLVDEHFVGTITVTQEFYASCLDLLLSGQTKSGVYKIKPDSQTAFKVYCDQETFGGGWTLFQRRVSGDEDFNRVWADYKTGFGELSSNFWLGNDYIHRLSTNKRELLLDLDSIPGDHTFILYKSFQVENEDAFYKLHVSEYQQSVGDCLNLFNGMKFSTNDQDNDARQGFHCGKVRQAGWWYKRCVNCHLNGLINSSAVSIDRLRMDEWQGNRIFLDRSEMKLRDREVVTCNDQYCYYLLKSTLLWNAAVAKCRSFNADLLSVRDATENQWIVNNILKNQSISRVHLGIYNMTRWTDGSTFTYNNFPTPNFDDGCPYLRVDGVWDAGDCGNLTHVLCKRAKFCYKDACHVFTTQRTNYNAAEGYCRDIGYNIVKINSKEKNEYVANVIKSLTMSDDWIKPYIGLRRSGPEFVWYDGTRLSLDNWRAGEPNEPDSDCVEMEVTGLWSDALCSSDKAVVCEKVYSPEKKPVDCLELLMSGSVRSGVYTIDPDGEGTITVYCDQENFGGGWTILLRRKNYGRSFNQKWKTYRLGFCRLDLDFWLGNDFIHKLTRISKEVLFDLKSNAGNKAFVHYKTFKVADESDSYRLTIGDYQTSAAGDAMVDHNNMLFSTKDRDNDLDDGNCAADKSGGWWYRSCGPGRLSGQYGRTSADREIKWGTWTNNVIINEAEMKIRSKSVVSCTDHFCYYRTSKKSTWTEAIKECRRFNADLVSIHSEVDQQWIITNILTPQSLDEIYIGLGMESMGNWTDESRVSFSKITPMIPSNKCVILKQDGSWDMVDCTQPKHVLCKRGKFCFKGDCYVVNTTIYDYRSVNVDYCQSIGYNLAKISNEEENRYVGDVIRQSSVDNTFHECFIGLILVNDRHQWPDSTMLQYSSWRPGQPHMGNDVNTVFKSDNSWIDTTTAYPKYPLCEKVDSLTERAEWISMIKDITLPKQMKNIPTSLQGNEYENGPIVNSCAEVRSHGRKESGFYSVSAGGIKQFTVYCDLSSDDSPWTIIQRRLHGSAPADYHSKSWTDYKNGFKSDEMNFWLGNKYVHELTKTPQRLKIVITTEEFNFYEAVYEDLTVGDEASGFEINFGLYSGTAGDSFSKHRGMRFSAVDQDITSTSCTSTHPGGWWFADCLDSNLNGMFDTASNHNETVFWRTINEKIVKTEMKIQPYDNKVSNTQFSGIIRIANASLGMSFTSDSTEIKVQTPSEEWTTHVPSPGPFPTHVAITWDENHNLRYYENGSLRAESASAELSGKDNEETSMSVYREYVWLNELKLWNSVLPEFSAKNQHSTRNFTFEDDGYLWTFENSSKPYSWQISSNCTPSELTGPCGDHTYLTSLGTFIFAEASRPAEPNDRAVMTSPNLPGCYRCLKFWVHMLGEKFGSLNIHFSTNTSIISTLDIPVSNVGGSHGNRWKYMQVDVDVANVFRIVIEARRGDGSKTDIAVDDVMLTTTSCEKECHPPCKIGEKCDPLSLVCVYEGYYDHRWRLDSLSITDEKDSKLGVISGDVQLQSDGVIENCTALRGDGKIEFRTIERRFYYAWCYPYYTLSFWLKYEEMDSQKIISFGELVKITQTARTPKEHLSVEVKTAYRKCSTFFFVPSQVWAHVIVSVNAWEGVVLVYLDGNIVANTSRFLCTDHDEVQSYNETSLTAGGDSNVNFALDDVRLLFDAPEMSETVESYKSRTGFGQTIFIRAEVATETWSDKLLDDESENYKQLSEMIKTKIMETFQNRSQIKDVVVERFTQGSVIADINIIYDKVTYQDILLVEEAIYLNNTFNGLNVQSYEFNSTSVPNVSPTVLTCISPNATTIYLNWTEVTSLDLNGIFQGYKVLYRITEQSAYTEYTAEVSYGNKTEIFLHDMEMYTNYTVRVLAFTLSGDGFISDSVTVMTLDGVPETPNITVTNISSTSLYVNWTMLPNTTNFYKQLQGYHILYWKESEEDKIFNLTQFENYILLENLEMWTFYCLNVTAFSYGNIGITSEIQCARTFEGAPEEPPGDVAVRNTNVTAIELSWLPPNESAIPGILRYYNLSYRILNDSSSEITSLSFESSKLTYAITGLPALALVQINISAFTVASGPAHTMMALTDEGVPLIAPNLTSITVSSSSYQVKWTRIPKIFHNGIFLGFHLYIWKQIDGNESAQNITYTPAVGLDQFLGVAKWTIFCAQVAGFTAVGDGPRSTVECTRTFEDAPEAPPSDLKATNVTNSTIDLEWSPPPSNLVPGIIRQYNLTYRNLNYTDELLTEEYFDPSVTSYRMENLIGLTLYEVNVTATTVLPGPWATLYVLTLEGVPAIVPPNAMWLNTSSTSLQVDWSMIPKPLVNGILLGYRIFIWKESEGPASKWNVTVPPTSNTSEIADLEKYTRYCGQIEAFTRVGVGPRSLVECMRTSEDAVEIAPGFSNVSNITWNECHLSWEPVVNSSFVPGVLRAYRVTYRIMDPRFDQSNTTFLVDSQFNSTVVTGLIGFVDYQIMVNGYTIKDGPVSISYFKTKEGVPTSPPAGFLSTDVTITTITIGWQEIPLPERHGIITGYELTYKKTTTRSKRDVEKTLTFDANTHSAFLYKLVAYTNYTITLRGRTSIGYGIKGEIIIETLQGAPSVAPKGFSGVNFTGPTSIFLSWGSLSQEELQGTLSGYEVRYQAFSVADEELLEPPPEEVGIVYGNSVKFTGLSTYTTYKVSVAAISGGGKGVPSRQLYVATCRCHKTLNTNFWNYQPYLNISGHNTDRGFFPYLLDMVTLYCCQNCLEHGTTDIDYFHDGEGRPSEKASDIDVKTNLTLNIDYSFPVYGFFGQTAYSKYYGYASIVEVVGTVFFTLKPGSSGEGNFLLTSILSIMPFLAIAVIFAYIAGVIIWALERRSNQDEFPPTFIRGAANGFWWAYITMTTVGYGDKTARTLPGRIFAVVWVLIGLVIGSLLIGSIATAFTSTTSTPDDSVKMLYGAKVAALHDSPDHKLGVRRNAQVNKLKKYWSVEDVRQALLSKKVDGMLIDSYVADSRRNLFSDLSVKQVIDLRSSYGVVMGTDASKIRKCINKFWKENAATRIKFMTKNVKPVEPTEVSSAEVFGETLSHEADMYKLTLYICLILLCVGTICGCIYELKRRKKRATKVKPENLPDIKNDLIREVSEFLEKISNHITETKAKHKKQIIALCKWKRKNKKQSDKYTEEGEYVSTEMTPIPS